MKQNYIFITILVMIFGLTSLVIIKSKSPLLSKATTQNKAAQGPMYKIAILLQMSHPALEEIIQGFLGTLESNQLNFTYDLYNANGNRTLLRSQAEEIITKPYDLIFTVPTTPSLIMKEVCEQRNKHTPIVAGAVDDPVGIKLVASMQSSGNNVTAVTGIEMFHEQIKLLQFFKPTTQNILLVYSPSPALDKKKDEIQKICATLGIHLKPVEIFNLNDLLQKVPNFIDHCDTVLVLKDNLVVSGIESLVNLCNKTNKTLYASDLNSGDKGAALSYGVREAQDGIESAYKALEILKNGKKPSEIPSTATTAFKIKINTQTGSKQGLRVLPELLAVMKSGEVV